jgi:hypothetical protein
VTRTTTLDLSPAKWHYRLPFFGKEVNDTSIIVDGNTPEIMGKELEYAAQVRFVVQTTPCPSSAGNHHLSMTF